MSVWMQCIDQELHSLNYSLTHLARAAGDETLQFSARSQVDDWSLFLESNIKVSSPELSGTRTVWSCINISCQTCTINHCFI